jgi:hypothetical protein
MEDQTVLPELVLTSRSTSINVPEVKDERANSINSLREIELRQVFGRPRG